MTADALFETDGHGRFSPTVAATGPWDRGLVHGAALAALFANRLRRDDRTLARLVVELSAPVPMAPRITPAVRRMRVSGCCTTRSRARCATRSTISWPAR